MEPTTTELQDDLSIQIYFGLKLYIFINLLQVLLHTNESHPVMLKSPQTQVLDWKIKATHKSTNTPKMKTIHFKCYILKRYR